MTREQVIHDLQALADAFCERDGAEPMCLREAVRYISAAQPTAEYTFEEAFQKTVCEQRLYCPKRPQGDNKEALFVLNHLFYDCDNMTQKEYDILLEAIKEADNETDN